MVFVVPAIAGEAQRFAMQAAPGEVIDSELEYEDGVMVYEFEIQQGDDVREVKVDANTGAILANAIANGEQAETNQN